MLWLAETVNYDIIILFIISILLFYLLGSLNNICDYVTPEMINCIPINWYFGIYDVTKIPIQVNIVIARIVTARIGYSTIRSWTPKFYTPFLGSLPENCVIKASCYTYTIYQNREASAPIH